MKAKKRLEITWETHETTVIRLSQNQAVLFCESCQENVPHFSEAQVASILSDSESAMLRLAEAKEIHLRETGKGFLMCANSLLGIGKQEI